MTAKRMPIGERPGSNPDADHWIRCGEGLGDSSAATTEVAIYTARLTIDVTPQLRGRIKVAAFQRGLTVAGMLRALFDQAFPDGDSRP